LWFLPKHHKSAFYLLPKINTIDSILKLVKYPKELKKNQKSLTLSIGHYHANEYRALVTHSLIYILKGKFRNKQHYYNLVKYILFLRLLRQDYVSESDNKIAQLLIDSFIEEFPQLYGLKNLSHNLHSNLHLPEQVAKHGNKCDAYAGENCFKELKKNVNGPTHIPRQIAESCCTKNRMRKYLALEMPKIERWELKQVYHRMQSFKNETHIYLHHKTAVLIDPLDVCHTSLNLKEFTLFLNYMDKSILVNTTIQTSQKIYYKNKCKSKIFIQYSFCI
jgi:hypothetical protein